MAVSFLSPSRTVLLISDDALYIYNAGTRGSTLVETVPWSVDNFSENVAKILTKDCAAKPILILNDMVEQHYRKERLVRAGVGFLDKAGMLKRKLGMAFPNYPVRAAYPLKEKVPKSDKGRPADIYIFAALPASNQFSQTIEATTASLSPIAGLCLLPVEASDMVKTLSDKIRKTEKNRLKSKWIIFMGQHKSGGLRQIVTKNGELALTRMTSITDVDVDEHEWAADVQNELKATMSYLSRFGYHQSEGLDIIVVGDPAACAALEGRIEEQCNYNALTAASAAQMLGIPFATASDDRYADILHVGWAGRKRKFILPMSAPKLERISKPRRMAMMASALLLLGAAFFGYEVYNDVQALSALNSDIDRGQKIHRQLSQEYQSEVERKEQLGFDVRLVQGSVEVFDDLEKNKIDALGLFSGVASALPETLSIEAIRVERAEPAASGRSAFDQQEGNKPEPLFKAKIQMSYPATTDIDRGNNEVRALSLTLKSILPAYDFRVTKFLKDYEYVEQIVVESGDLGTQSNEQDFIAEIEVSGVVPND